MLKAPQTQTLKKLNVRTQRTLFVLLCICCWPTNTGLYVGCRSVLEFPFDGSVVRPEFHLRKPRRRLYRKLRLFFCRKPNARSRKARSQRAKSQKAKNKQTKRAQQGGSKKHQATQQAKQKAKSKATSKANSKKQNTQIKKQNWPSRGEEQQEEREKAGFPQNPPH